MDLLVTQKMKKRQIIKDIVIALSLSNLCFIITWNDLLNSPIRRFNTCLAIIINVILLGAILWTAITLARRSHSQLALRIARLFFPLVLLLPLNGISKLLFPRVITLDTFIIIGLAVTVMSLYEIMPWHSYIIRSAEIVAIVLFPFSLILMSYAGWFLINRPGKPIVPAFTNGNASTHRVLCLVFDEMDQHLSFSNRPATVRLPELDRLRGQAVYATNVFPPSDSTLVSIPAIITGKLLSKARLVDQSKLMITSADSEKSVNWGDEPNLFSKAREAGFNTTLVGWYLPYCSLIGGSLTHCSWIDTEAETLHESIARQIENAISTVPIASNYVIANSQQTEKLDDRKKSVEHYLKTMEAAKEALADPDAGLVFVHFSVPHPPGIYDRRKDKFEVNRESSYLDNLQLVDAALAELRRTMEDAHDWDRTIMLVTSDHWWRSEIWRPTDFWTSEDTGAIEKPIDHRVPFLLKLAGQKQAVTYEPVFNNVLTCELLLGLLRGELSGPDSVVQWLDQHRSIGESPYRFNSPK